MLKNRNSFLKYTSNFRLINCTYIFRLLLLLSLVLNGCMGIRFLESGEKILYNKKIKGVKGFSLEEIESLYENFPDFTQNETRMAIYGKSTSQAVEEHGLTINIQAPMPDIPSMSMALDNYLKEANGPARKG